MSNLQVTIQGTLGNPIGPSRDQQNGEVLYTIIITNRTGTTQYVNMTSTLNPADNIVFLYADGGPALSNFQIQWTNLPVPPYPISYNIVGVVIDPGQTENITNTVILQQNNVIISTNQFTYTVNPAPAIIHPRGIYFNPNAVLCKCRQKREQKLLKQVLRKQRQKSRKSCCTVRRKYPKQI